MDGNLIKEKHSGGLGGHFGANKTYEQMNKFYFWPEMRSEVERYVKIVKYVSMQREGVKTQVCMFHYLIQIGLGIW